MPTEKINGVNIYYELDGTGEETLVILNGIMMSTASWNELVPVCTRRYRLLRVDFRNQGKSEYCEEYFDIGIHVEDLECLLQRLELEKVHMVGISYGAEVAMLFALKYPQRLGSLILSNTTPRVTRHLRAIGNSWDEAAKLYDGEKFFRLVMPLIYSDNFYETNWQWMQYREKLFGKTLTREWFDAYLRLSASTRSYDIVDRLQEIEVPTLVMASDRDIITPLSEARLIHERIKGSRLLIIPGAGHASCYEKKDEFNTAVLGFIEAVGR